MDASSRKEKVGSARRRSLPRAVSFQTVRPEYNENESGHESKLGVVERAMKDPLLLALSSLLILLSFVAIMLNKFEVQPIRPHLTSLADTYGLNSKLDVILDRSSTVGRSPKTHTLTWRVTSGLRSPDGVLKRVYLINGQYPGPLLEARVGDVLEVTVANDLQDRQDEGMAMHFHGLHNRGRNEMDGTVGMTQCPIMPGTSYTYVIELSQVGTFWYHSHDQVQRADGLYGGLVVHDAEPVQGEEKVLKEVQYDEERLLLIGDWYHRPASDVLAWYLQAASFGNEPVPDSLVVNGFGAFDCSMIVPARPVDCDSAASMHPPVLTLDFSKKYRLRLVNVGTLAGMTIRIPGSTMLPINVDGGSPVLGEAASSVGVLYPGERVDLIVSFANGPLMDEPHIEIELEKENFKYPNPALTRKQKFEIVPLNLGSPRYASLSASRPATTFDLGLVNATGSPVNMPVRADVTFVLYTTTMKLAKNHNVPEGFINQTSWHAQKTPLITLPRSEWDRNQLVPFIQYNATAPKWVDIVLNNLDDGSHPFHLHSNDFYVLSSCADGTYWGSYNPFDTSVQPPCGSYNLVNPVRKDTVYVPKRGYVVLRFVADNPGIHMFHCHILWHQASGMAMGFHVGDNEDANMSQHWPRERLDPVIFNCQ